MKPLFAVLRTRGGAWEPSVPLEKQQAWDAHARFMDSLAEEGFVILVGPLEGTLDFLLIARAASVHEIVQRLAADPWTTLDLLRQTRIDPWILRIGSLP